MPDRDETQRPPLPTVVLGGWLGAGKTTLLNRWLRDAGGLRLAVLVNDFGDISIDADLIVGADDDVISLAGGCICCAVGSDLFGALRRITARQPRPDLLLVETSGVALPAAVARTVLLVPDIEVRAVVVLVDVPVWHEQLADRYVADTVRQQVAEADLLVLSKSRETGGSSVRKSLQDLAPATLVLDADLDADLLRRAVLAQDPEPWSRSDAGRGSTLVDGQDGDGGPPERSREVAPVSPAVLRRPGSSLAPAADRFESRLERFDGPVDPQLLAANWTAPEARVVRAKGWVTGLDGQRWRIQLVGRRANLTPDDEAPPEDRVVVIRLRT